MLTGLSQWQILRIPPGFCTNAVSALETVTSDRIAAAVPRRLSSMSSSPSSHLFVEPDVLHAPIVDDTVDHHRPALYRRLPAIGEAVVEDDRAGPVLCQLSFDLPHQLSTRSRVGFHRLPIEQLFELGIAIAGVVAWRTTAVVLVQLLVGIIDAAAGEIGANHVVLARDLGKPARGLDDLELAVDEHLLQLVGQQHGRIAVRRDIAGRHLELQPPARTIAEGAHDRGGFGRFFCMSGSYPGSVFRTSSGIPHSPSGKGCMTPPISPWPSLMMSIKARRSMLSAIARRISG